MNLPEQVFLVNPPENTVLLSGNRYQVISPNCLDDIEDFTKVCRTCATVTDNNVPIFQGEGLRRNLAETIGQYLPIKVSHDDDLPQVLCVQCANTLLAFKDLSACCLLADVALRTRSSKGFLEESKPSVDCDSVSLKPIDEPAADFPDAPRRPRRRKKSRNQPEAPAAVQMADARRYRVCPRCQRCVSTKSWARHVARHGTARHACGECGASFTERGNLARHLRAVHQRLRPFACAACAKRFSRAESLRDHSAAHSLRRDFVCEACGRAFKSGAALRVHRKKHPPPDTRSPPDAKGTC